MADPTSKYGSGESVHAVALRYASVRDGIVPLLFALHGEIDASVGQHLDRASPSHLRLLLVADRASRPLSFSLPAVVLLAVVAQHLLMLPARGSPAPRHCLASPSCVREWV